MSEQIESGAKLKLPLSIGEIQDIIPHRYPFLFIDRVTEFVDRSYIVGQKNVSINEPYFQGHFPGRPIMPGVLMIEALAQLGVLFARLCTEGISKERLLVFAAVDDVRFRRLVVPGDVLTLKMSLLRYKLGHWKMGGEVTANNQVVMEAVLMASELSE